MIGASVFALCMWLRFEPGLGEWITKLELSSFYIGVYVLIIASAIMMIVSFIGCIAALQENTVMVLIVSTYSVYTPRVIYISSFILYSNGCFTKV